MRIPLQGIGPCGSIRSNVILTDYAEENGMKKMKCLMFAAVFMLLTGCVASNAAVSTGKTAYVVKGNMFGTQMYHCDASTGTPVCTAVVERPLAGGGQ